MNLPTSAHSFSLCKHVLTVTLAILTLSVQADESTVNFQFGPNTLERTPYDANDNMVVSTNLTITPDNYTSTNYGIAFTGQSYDSDPFTEDGTISWSVQASPDHYINGLLYLNISGDVSTFTGTTYAKLLAAINDTPFQEITTFSLEGSQPGNATLYTHNALNATTLDQIGANTVNFKLALYDDNDNPLDVSGINQLAMGFHVSNTQTQGGDEAITFGPVPEPSSSTLLLASFTTLLLRRRRA